MDEFHFVLSLHARNVEMQTNRQPCEAISQFGYKKLLHEFANIQHQLIFDTI